jgi:hypothetical protein
MTEVLAADESTFSALNRAIMITRLRPKPRCQPPALHAPLRRSTGSRTTRSLCRFRGGASVGARAVLTLALDELRESQGGLGVLSHSTRSGHRTIRSTNHAHWRQPTRLAPMRPWSLPWSLSERISDHLRAAHTPHITSEHPDLLVRAQYRPSHAAPCLRGRSLRRLVSRDAGGWWPREPCGRRKL